MLHTTSFPTSPSFVAVGDVVSFPGFPGEQTVVAVRAPQTTALHPRGGRYVFTVTVDGQCGEFVRHVFATDTVTMHRRAADVAHLLDVMAEMAY